MHQPGIEPGLHRCPAKHWHFKAKELGGGNKVFQPGHFKAKQLGGGNKVFQPRAPRFPPDKAGS